MKDYENCSFFEIYQDAQSCESNIREKIKIAFNEFIDLIFYEVLEKKDLTKLYSNLIMIKAELLSFQKNIDLTNKEGAVKQDYIEKALIFLEAQINLIKWEMTADYSPRLSPTNKTKYGIFQWTANLADLVELAYGLCASEAINHGDVEVKDLVSFLAETFNVPIKNPYATYRDMRKRVGKSRTFFLDEMGNKLNKRMDDADNGIIPKKKGR